MKRMFPLFINLEGRRCLVVGAGKVSESKVASLLETGCVLDVVAPHATGKIETWSRKGKLHWCKRRFRNCDLTGCFLVVAATSSTKLHEKIFRLARQQGIICNVVDVPELCDFYYPAVVRRGSLQIAVSTGGESPALAQRLRKKLEGQFGPEYVEWIAELGEARKRVLVGAGQSTDQKAQLHAMASEKSFQQFRKLREKNGRKTGRKSLRK
jgi:precorrin-2 dehydrogenase/sirohydrochlorin ferrochelatase